MPSVEKRFILTKGPPWGFRLYLDNNGVLTISKIRRHSPAESSNLHSGDQIIKLNGRSTTGMTHAEAVNLIDTSIGTLDLLVTRFESVSTKFMTSIDKADSGDVENSKLNENIKAKMKLQLKRNTDSPEIPTVPVCTPEVEIRKLEEFREVKDVVIPSSPDVQPISISKLIKEYSEPEDQYNYVPKKKHFADSAFYSEPQNLYPTMEERVDMARKVALSLTAPDNLNSKGASIFERQRQKAEKYTLKKDEDGPTQPSNEIQTYDLDHWPQVADNREKSPSPMFKLGYSTKQSISQPPAPPAAPPPPPPPNEAKTIQEFMEKVQKFPKAKHNEITPQACFDIAAALHSSDSRGAQLFAQKKNRSKKWELTTPEPVQSQPQMASSTGPWNDHNVRPPVTQPQRAQPRVISVVRNTSRITSTGPGNQDYVDNSAIQGRKPSLVIRRNSNQGSQESNKITNPISIAPSKSFSQPQPKEASQLPTTSQWKPVKFNIPQKA